MHVALNARPVIPLENGVISPRARLVERELRAEGAGTSREISIWKDEDPAFPLKRLETVYSEGPAGRQIVHQQAFLADRLLIEVHNPSPQLDRILSAHKIKIEDRLTFSPVFRLRLPSASIRAYDRLLEQLKREAEPGRWRVGRDGLARLAAVPNDPFYLTNQLDLDLIGAPSAWDFTTGSAAVVVAVIDSGMDMDHPDLAGNLFTNPGEIAGNGLDDDGNGLIDDLHGWDFQGNDANPDDINGHGTGVAGIIGAVGNNATGVAGTAWQCQLMPLKAGNSTLPWSAIIQAIDYCIWMKGQGITLAAINNSYGGQILDSTELSMLAGAVNRTEAADILFVAAAGNTFPGKDNDAVVGGIPQHFYPSSFPNANILSVASTNNLDQLAVFSNFGAVSVDLAAPGDGIYTTTLNGTYGNFNGTSMSCARVSGLAALLVSLNPDLIPYYLRRILIDTGVFVTDLIGKLANPVRVDAGAAMQLAGQSLFDLWRRGYWGTDFASLPGADPAADPDHDGWDNLWEYALWGNPLLASSPHEREARPRPVWFEVAGNPFLGFDLSLNSSDASLMLYLEANETGLEAGWSEVLPGYFQSDPDPALPAARLIRLGAPASQPFDLIFLRLGVRFQSAP